MPIILSSPLFSFSLPTSWKDVSVSAYLQYFHLQTPNIADVVHVFTGLTPEQIELIDTLQYTTVVLPAIHALVSSPIDIDSLPLPESLAYPKELTNESYGQKEDALLSIEAGKPLVLFTVDLLSIYLCDPPYDADKADAYRKKVEAMPITEAYPVAKHIYNQLMSVQEDLNAYLKHFQVPYTDEERIAGIPEFNQKWGSYAAIHNLAPHYGGEESVVRKSVAEIHTKLKFLAERSYRDYKKFKEIERNAKRK